ncbi:MAG: glycosyltransferase [Deltaproteobacteria bacterium]|nr:glycosyltransferase [Deltaproteobacteria bacterium]
MKLLLLSRSLEVGGAERQLTTLAKALPAAGHQPLVAVFYPGGALEDELKEAGVPLVSLDKAGRWDLWGFGRRLGRLIREEQPDAIYSFLVEPNLAAAVAGRRHPGLRVAWGVRVSHLLPANYDAFSRFTLRISARLAPWAHVIIANSRAGLEHHLRLGYPAARLVVIENGIDTGRFVFDPAGRRRMREKWGVAPDRPLVGLVGRLDPVKDHATFMEAAALVSRRHPEAVFVAVGGGPAAYRGELEGKARGLGLEGRMIWAGQERDMPAVYSALDLHCSASAAEGLPNAVAEAMSAGVPSVVTDVGDSRVLVGDTGAVVPPGDPAALAGALNALGERLMLEKTALRQAARARIVENYSLGRMVERTVAAIQG